MSIIKKLSLFIVLFFFCMPVSADDGPSVNFFYGIGCPHCAQVEPFIEEIKPKYPEINFNTFEVYHNRENSLKLSTWFDSYNVPSNRRGVPVVFVDGAYIIGDTSIIDNLESEIEKLISENSESEAGIDSQQESTVNFDPVPEIETENEADLQKKSEASDEQMLESPESSDNLFINFLHKKQWWLIAFLLLGIFYMIYRFWVTKKVCICFTEKQKDFITVVFALLVLLAFFFFAKNISPEFLEEVGYTLPLPVFTFFIALVDGFNPCNLFVLTFLLALLTSASHSRGRIYIVGFSFILMVFAIYFLFMAAWLNIFKFIGFITPLRIAIAMIAIIAGVINCKELLFFRKGVTLMIQDKHKGPLVKKIEHMKEIISKGTLPVLISSSIALAAFASLVELPCTAGFPIIYTGILSAKSLGSVNYYLYLLLYAFFYILPLTVIILIFGYTFRGKKISKRQMQIIKFIGGIIMILLGIILLVNPGMIGIAA